MAGNCLVVHCALVQDSVSGNQSSDSFSGGMVKNTTDNNNQEDIVPPVIKSHRFITAAMNSFKWKLPQQLIHQPAVCCILSISTIKYNCETCRNMAFSHSACHVITITHDCLCINMLFGSSDMNSRERVSDCTVNICV